MDENDELLLESFRAKITERTRLIAVAHVSNVRGTESPVREILTEAPGHGIVMVVDGTQAVAHRTVDVRDIDVDFYAFSAHKMYGPHGAGVLYDKAERLTTWRRPRAPPRGYAPRTASPCTAARYPGHRVLQCGWRAPS
ncbi:hypothetical protein B7P34_06260 [Streptosporangium nondiastaticum]|uniref:Aminotransferase class V domain-containing protein n=1 Tax=Streptosporangium nondiastaticum TaxID=35764 RepID=A0A9X7JTI8_9ACTN|nr:hypothetical protein B7P34_06260 [Streptosporangium nondiastaticum]